jgi:hypothetical protein
LGFWERREEDLINEQDVRVAGGTADINTVELLIVKRSLCHIILCNYKNASKLEFFQIVAQFLIILS